MPKGWQENNYVGGVSMMAIEKRDIAVSSNYPYSEGVVNDSWSHKIGRTCFTRTIDKDIYPVFKKEIK
jgi:hypothetical protein